MLNIYSLYSRYAGEQDGALLVFAHTVREARKVGWENGGTDLTDEYIDIAARRLRDLEYLRDEADLIKLHDDVPHLVWNIKSCKQCEMWGRGRINEDGLCQECQDENDDANPAAPTDEETL